MHACTYTIKQLMHKLKPGLPYRITRLFCEHQTFANFAMVDQFATIKSAKPKLLLVNTHDPCQNAIVKSQRVTFFADLAHSQMFFTRIIFSIKCAPRQINMHTYAVLTNSCM